MSENQIIKLMEVQNGYATTSEILNQGIAFSDIRKLDEEGKIERIKRGLYRLQNDSFMTPIQEFIDVCKAIPKSVICLYSSLSHYELTTYIPTDVMLAIPQGYHAPRLEFPPIRVFHFSKNQYEAGIENIETSRGTYRIYSPEKSVCDAFRFRNKLGDDTAKESLFNYLERQDRNIEKLMDLASICRMKHVMKPYIEAKIG